MDESRFAELIELYLDAELSDQEAAELRAHLEAQPAHVVTMLKATKTHVLCRTAFRPAAIDVIRQRIAQLMKSMPTGRHKIIANRVMLRIRRRQHLHFWGRWATVAAAALLLLWLRPWQWNTSLYGERNGQVEYTSARVIALTGNVTTTDRKVLRLGSEISEQACIHTKSASSATIQWPEGTQIVIHELSTILQLSFLGQHLRLENGSIAVQAAHRPSTNALIIDCPDMSVRVVGTQFSLAVTEGQSQIQVSEGLVLMKRNSDGQSRLLGAGEQTSSAIMPPSSALLSTERVFALREAIKLGRQPWAAAWQALEQQIRPWSTDPIMVPERMICYSYVKEPALHDNARGTYGGAAQKTLGLALAARLSQNSEIAHAAAQQAAKLIRAWIAVPLEGVNADYFASDTGIVFLQAADLIRCTATWTAKDDEFVSMWLQQKLEPHLSRMAKNRFFISARWRSVTDRLLIAGWNGDMAYARAQMDKLMRDVSLSQNSLSLPEREKDGEGGNLQAINQAIMASDVARNLGIMTPPPPSFQLALEALANETDIRKEARGGILFISPLFMGAPPWRLPWKGPLSAGPMPNERIAFSWYFPVLIGLDPRTLGDSP